MRQKYIKTVTYGIDFICIRFYDRRSRLHRESGPASITLFKDQSVIFRYYRRGNLERPAKNGIDQPAHVEKISASTARDMPPGLCVTYYNNGWENRGRLNAAGELLPYEVFTGLDGDYSLRYGQTEFIVFGNDEMKSLQGNTHIITYKFIRQNVCVIVGTDPIWHSVTPERAHVAIEVPKTYKLTEMPFNAIRPPNYTV